MNNNQKIIEIIDDCLQYNNMSDKEMLLACNIPIGFLSKWRNNSAMSPNFRYVVTIANYLKIDLEYLFNGSQKENPIEDLKVTPLIERYNQLNNIGKSVALERISELAEIPKYYSKDTLNIPYVARNKSNDNQDLIKSKEDLKKLYDIKNQYTNDDFNIKR